MMRWHIQHETTETKTVSIHGKHFNKKLAVGHLDCIELVACFVDLFARFSALGRLY